MPDKELIKKLNQLKTIKPDNNWKDSYREILFSQISAGAKVNSVKPDKFVWTEFYKKLIPHSIMVELAWPVWLIIISLTVVSSGSIASIYASRDAKPGDSLYLAKIIGEKAKLAVTFDEKSKVKLNLEFASNRAQEITQVISETRLDAEQDNSKVEQLSRSFKKEITEAKNRISKINIGAAASQETADNKSAPTTGDEDQEVFGANLEKDNQRMEISEPEKAEKKAAQEATSTPFVADDLSAASSTINETTAASASAGKILDEAEKLFDEKNYNGTIDKLEEVNKMMDQSKSDNNGAVKGAEDSISTNNSTDITASSTQ